MTTSYRDAAITSTRTKRGAGSIRQRSPGVWEIRVVVGFDAVFGRSVQRSFTVHGDAEYAQRRRRELVDGYGVSRVEFTTAGARLTVGELLERFFEAPHLWKPATVVSHRPVIHALLPLGGRQEAAPSDQLRRPGRCRAGPALGQLMYDLRTEAGLSQRALAERMGTTQSVISRLEEGGGAKNRLDTLARVATALNRHLIVSFPEKVPARLKDAVQVA